MSDDLVRVRGRNTDSCASGGFDDVVIAPCIGLFVGGNENNFFVGGDGVLLALEGGEEGDAWAGVE